MLHYFCDEPYTPQAGFAASDEFTYRATNGTWVSNLATVTINNESRLPADLTGNGFVDFEDLTVLLANWNQNVSAAEGNLVDAGGSPVNFEDLTVLLAAWTGPGPAGAPQAAVGRERPGPVEEDRINPVTTSGGDDAVMLKHNLRAARRAALRSRSASGTHGLGRLQASAVDRAMDETTQLTLDRRAPAIVRRRR